MPSRQRFVFPVVLLLPYELLNCTLIWPISNDKRNQIRSNNKYVIYNGHHWEHISNNKAAFLPCPFVFTMWCLLPPSFIYCIGIRNIIVMWYTEHLTFYSQWLVMQSRFIMKWTYTYLHNKYYDRSQIGGIHAWALNHMNSIMCSSALREGHTINLL